jgi:hypothetical protein
MSTTGKKVLIGCGIAFGIFIALIIVLILVLGAAIETGYIPEETALPAGKIHPRYIRQLKQIGVINPDEKVLYFYSGSLVSVKNEGNLYTKDRVISYQKYNDELEIYSAPYHEIAAIEFEPSESWIEDSNITVTLIDGSWFEFSISTFSDGDKKFYNKLLETWERNKEDITLKDQQDQ